MMKFETNKYKIEIRTESYDDEWIPKIRITIYESDQFINNTLIYGSIGSSIITESTQIIEEEYITLCCSKNIHRITIPELYQEWKVSADPVSCFQVFTYKDDYIIHGEVYISRINSMGDIIWQQSGADIFTTVQGSSDDFIITDEYILATDWNHKKYKFDFNGNILGF